LKKKKSTLLRLLYAIGSFNQAKVLCVNHVPIHVDVMKFLPQLLNKPLM
jgi:hypothetical protein